VLHVGVDLHKRRAQMAVMDDAGILVTNCSVACDRESMKGFFARLSGPTQVVVEATSNWYWLCDLLEEIEVPVRLAHPLKTKAIASARIKTDKLDAATLAHLLRADLVPRAHLSSPQISSRRGRCCRARSGDKCRDPARRCDVYPACCAQ
jgi:transposase